MMLRIVVAVAAILALLLCPHAPAAQPAWISTGQAPDSRPCPVFRKRFEVSGPVKGATLRMVGLGHFDVYINGQRVGDTLMNEPWSAYDKTIYVQSFDVGNLVHQGPNALGAVLGNSFWRVGPVNDPGRYSKTDALPGFSAGRNFLIHAELEINLEQGGPQVVTSDSSWRWADGPLTFSHIYAGEDFDARVLPRSWTDASFDDAAWTAAVEVEAPKAALADYDAPPIRAFDVFDAVEIKEPAPGVYTYVFPQNCAALVRFSVQGPRGSTVRFKPCEYMDAQGRVKFTYTWGTHKDIWLDYILSGDGDEHHDTLFCYDGAQYVEMTGGVPAGRPNPSGLPVIGSVQLVSVRAACPTVGSFSCSSDMLQRAHAMIDWSIRSNMSYVATDCPHREKNGWQEQNWHMARAMSYRYDTHAWMRKILRDVRDTQLADGHVPTNCPNYLVGVPPHGFWNEAPEWGIASVLVPWHLYEWYGDEDILRVSFDSMCRYVDYLTSTASDGLITSNLGDWYDYGHGKGNGPSKWTPAQVSATAVWALGARTCAQAAGVLGRAQPREKFQKLYETIRADFQKHFYDAGNATVKNNGSCQAGTAAALCAGLIPHEDHPRAIAAIVADLEARGFQQTAGEVLQVFLVRALAEGGRNDVLHRVFARTERGSYGYMVKQGLTTLPESWDAARGTGDSMNHFMLGHLLEWQYAYVAGIRQQPGSVGWRRVLIEPRPGELRAVDAQFESPKGLIRVALSTDDSGVHAEISIPAGLEHAVLSKPDGTTAELPAGVSRWSWNAR